MLRLLTVRSDSRAAQYNVELTWVTPPPEVLSRPMSSDADLRLRELMASRKLRPSPGFSTRPLMASQAMRRLVSLSSLPEARVWYSPSVSAKNPLASRISGSMYCMGMRTSSPNSASSKSFWAETLSNS